jgi:putative hydrolase of the HAD superfamily
MPINLKRVKNMIKAILWDFGGVITTSPFEAFNRYEEEHHLPKDFIRGINAVNPTTNAWSKLENGLISIDAFDREFQAESEAAGHPVPGKDVLRLLTGDVRPAMVRALKQCRRQFKVGCLTNNIKPDDGSALHKNDAQLAEYQDIMDLFDVVIASSVEGVRKPDPEIYRIALSRLAVNARECVFLDDLGINLKPARAMGMQTIKVLSVDQALGELAVQTGLVFQ